MSKTLFKENLKIDLAEIERLAERINAFADSQSIDTSTTYKINLVLDELLTNIINYAQASELNVSAEIDDKTLCFTLQDNGTAFNPLTDSKAPDTDASLEDREIGGLGVHFAKTFMSSLDYQRAGTTNILTLTLDLD
ncbi:ATP-binding protein [Terasakiella sp. A23]|uniref:ATP-binding protein n=1 Tax=Terasakiella sp. FCG-A23 TaxID=3080561 RepID=UPI002953AC90|nr:ATP-binding protein [Terasakiella sp. A23]MDV7340357.1 ATP-binding protein [Terasakiella sp. A23]